MDNFDSTVANEPRAESEGRQSPNHEQTLAELTRCLSDAYTARSRIRLKRGELSLWP